jgi:hypothetical protein
MDQFGPSFGLLWNFWPLKSNKNVYTRVFVLYGHYARLSPLASLATRTVVTLQLRTYTNTQKRTWAGVVPRGQIAMEVFSHDVEPSSELPKEYEVKVNWTRTHQSDSNHRIGPRSLLFLMWILLIRVRR